MFGTIKGRLPGEWDSKGTLSASLGCNTHDTNEAAARAAVSIELGDEAARGMAVQELTDWWEEDY